MAPSFEGLKVFTGVATLMGSAFVYFVTTAGLSALQLLAVCGLMSGALWMPYLMAMIILNGSNPIEGLYLKLAYKPLPAELPPWVKRAMVAHNNALENLNLFGLSVLLATAMSVPDSEISLAANIYFGGRVAHLVYTIAPPIFALKTMAWFVSHMANMFIFYKCLPPLA
eukprot:CAMPEP_0181213814 /NCGR_PEP_ID=MMETSP1096-20121128/25112_1 /TAXON_ID=156174 ORGANISM="Chrysochromulina ericina, Strain CCMP281" /NCGR_SAMPLE_ID=MMETSP1096 /ASSEMBLY_ACC=CAM_ASM_000453 /LENGTH=168 /DNA_ID=CAMNT_0023305491 /DNA_START=1 /DNA_END=507 /DNA_ORIENTATION=+